MRPRTRIHWLASAWILLGSGCDYWRNLVEPKKEDRVDLVLSVKDAWTGEALASAQCSVDGADAVGADAEGRISFPAAPTGIRTVDCSCASYHGRALPVDARPGGGPVEIPMARMGGDLWYPEDTARQVRIEIDSGSLIFPGDLVIRGLPGDSKEGTFRYAWSSSHHNGLRSLAKVAVRTGMHPGDSLQFTLSLTVTATLAGKTYEVGTASRPFTLAKNRQPTLEIVAFKPVAPVMVGTGCQVEPAQLHLKAVDPDGECRVRLSAKADSPLGALDTAAACSQLMSFMFPIRSENGPADFPFFRNGKIDLEVTDGNGGRLDTSLPVVTRTNMHPSITITQVGAKDYNLTDEEMKFEIIAYDPDTMYLHEVSVDWKNGEPDPPKLYSRLQRSYVYKDTVVHIFRDSGSYLIEAKVRDACQVVRTATLSIDLRDNRIPTLDVVARGFKPSTQEYEVLVEAFDGDVASGMDSITVVVTWGAMTDTLVHQDSKVFEKVKNFNEVLGISFRPVPNAVNYLIYVSVFDQFRAAVSRTIRLAPEQAFGPP